MLQNKKYIDNLQETIQEKLEENKISVKELERQAGLKVSAVQNILSGRSNNPGIETIIGIAKALDCSLEELFEGVKPHHAASDKIDEDHNSLAKVTWNCKLYQECAEGVDNYIKSKNLKANSIPNTKLILFLIKEAYIYSLEGGSNKADLRFIKWVVDSHCR